LDAVSEVYRPTDKPTSADIVSRGLAKIGFRVCGRPVTELWITNSWTIEVTG